MSPLVVLRLQCDGTNDVLCFYPIWKLSEAMTKAQEFLSNAVFRDDPNLKFKPRRLVVRIEVNNPAADDAGGNEKPSPMPAGTWY